MSVTEKHLYPFVGDSIVFHVVEITDSVFPDNEGNVNHIHFPVDSDWAIVGKDEINWYLKRLRELGEHNVRADL